MIGIKLCMKATTKKYRVPESSSKLHDQDVVPLQMIVPADVSKKRAKKGGLKKNDKG